MSLLKVFPLILQFCTKISFNTAMMVPKIDFAWRKSPILDKTSTELSHKISKDPLSMCN